MSDDIRDRFLSWRGVETPCKGCGGAGRKAYASTATWAGGIGGQAITDDVCDSCWGTGDADRKGVDLRNLCAEMRDLRRSVNALVEAGDWEAFQKARTAALRLVGGGK